MKTNQENINKMLHNAKQAIAEKDYDKALISWLSAEKRGLSTRELYISIGELWVYKKNDAKAKEYFEKALKIEPEDIKVLLHLAMIYLHRGNKEAIDKIVTYILKIDPKAYKAYYIYTRAKKHKVYDQSVQQMEILYNSEDTSDEGRMYLGYALGKVYEELERYDEAFECLKTANTIKSGTVDFSIETLIDSFDNYKINFNKKNLASIKKTGLHDKTPIFVVGMPRSGTSLTEQILSSHPSIYGAGELNILLDSIRIYGKEKLFSPETLKKIGQYYIDEIRKIAPTIDYIVDKQPVNYQLIPYIFLALPDAKIIHCVRNPMDICLSNYKNYFHTGRPMSNDLTALGIDYKLYEDLMAHYHSLFPGKIYDLVYEDLVEDQEEETKKLFTYLDIPWDDACLSHHKTKRSVKTMSSMQVKEPIYKSSVALWKRYEKQLQPLKKILEGERPVKKNKNSVKINGKEYDIESLSEESKKHLNNILFAENTLKKVQSEYALTKTALESYHKTFLKSIADNNTPT